jgi:tetratricopeptide (TPR) repeat protein
MEDTAKNFFDQGEIAFKSGDYETALERFNEAKTMYLSGNFDVMVIETNRYIKLITASQYFDDAMRYLGAGDTKKAFELLALAKTLYQELQEQRMVTLIEQTMKGETPEGEERGSRTIITGPGTQGLTYVDIFLIFIIAALVVYIFMRRSK